jgi:hypothetical protein
VLFFWLYNRFLQNTNFTSALLLGICMAFMLYSKYHGVLVIAFTLLSNPKLFANRFTYVAALVCLVLFAPHLYWQYQHNFPSFQYHLFERNASHYRFQFTSEYLTGQILFAGPIMGWFLLWAAFRYPPASELEKALKYTLAGTYIIFLISTYKGRVEANWTVAAFIPLMVLSHRYLVQHYQLQKWLYRSLPVTLLLVLAARLYLMSWFPTISWIKRNEFHDNRTWTTEMRQKAGNLPVVFVNTYQQASKYWFYTGIPAFSMNSPYYRRNNFNMWPIEDTLIGRDVYMDVPDDNEYFRRLFKPFEWTFPHDGVQKGFYSFSRVLFSRINCSVLKEHAIQINTEFTMPHNYANLFQQAAYSETPIWLALYEDGDVAALINSGITVKQLTGNAVKFIINIPPGSTKGEYTARLCIGSCLPGFPTINSTEFDLEVK